MQSRSVRVVEDNPFMRNLVRGMLTHVGVGKVHEAGDGIAALELIRAVRADATRRDIPILMVTTETESSQIVRALAAGASEYLMKPFMAEAISDKLEILGIGV